MKLTDTLRGSIEHAYEYHAAEPQLELKDIIDRICVEFGVDRKTVHEVVARLHGAHVKQRSAELTSIQKKTICSRYEAMVRDGIRPRHGRRREIARDLGLTQGAVSSVLAHWSWRHQDPRHLSRESKFQIEKAYWAHLHQNVQGSRANLATISDAVAEDTRLPLEAVVRWIDQLHDDPRLLDHVELPDPVLQEKIEEAYREYLSRVTPPEESLHRLLAERFGCSVRQAHTVLVIYRWRERLQFLETSPEQLAMLAEASRSVRQGGQAGA